MVDEEVTNRLDGPNSEITHDGDRKASHDNLPGTCKRAGAKR
jgi:hypothetical protein